MRQGAFQREVFRIIIICALGLAAGLSVGEPLFGLLGGLIVSQIISVRIATTLYRWAHRQGEAPQDNGLVGYSADRLVLREKNLKNRLLKQATQLQRYSQGIESLQDGVIILDQNGHITTFNGAAVRMLRLRKDDAGQHIKNLIRAPQFVRYFDKADYSEPLQFDIRMLSLQLQITEFGLEQKVMLIRDVTEKKRVETMRQNFIADVSHELRTPLTVINGYLEMFTGMDTPAPMARALEQMESQSRRMTGIVNDLIELSKLESASSERSGEWFSINTLCHEIVDQLQSYREDSHLRINGKVKAEIEGFPQEMRSVLTNLITNALKYGDDGDVMISLEHSLKGLKISVRDHGPGIPPEHINRLTERFYRVDESRESEIGGSGLGLSIVKHALEHHDATLQIDSAEGEGSTFSFVIPSFRVRQV